MIKDATKGRAEFKLDRTGTVHHSVGKASFENAKQAENLSAAMEAILKARPSGAKGIYIKSATVSTSMGPGIALDLRSVATTV